ncbi:porin [Massilia niastensis]|uniref:porin n=1 Tax=Massilia niastensis TaxID=544911 RepID=UPI000382AC4B|nr:porin [Massilia niastensis]
MNKTILMAAMAAAFAAPHPAFAADDRELAAIRAELREMKQSYEARLQALEQRLQEAQAAAAQAQNAAAQAQAAPAPVPAAPQPAAPASPAAAVASGSNAFNPAMSLVLGGTLSNIQQDPGQYRFQGFVPPDGEIGPGARSFNLGESELTLSANIDPRFAGQATFAITGENEVEVEEAYIRTRGLGNGLNLKAGRFMSGIGYLNSQHAHAWDFVDTPLAYQAFFGGQYKPDGIQARWLAPTEIFLELGAELASGRNFPGNDRNSNGAGARSVFARAGGDIGASMSWQAGLSYLRTRALDRGYEDQGVATAFSGRSKVWVADAVYKWAPDGNPTQRNVKLQGEWMQRRESGSLAALDASGDYRSRQSGWYLQGVYQFMPNWRAGLRHDRLSSGTTRIGLVDTGVLEAALFPALAAYDPRRSSVMLDYSPSEFSRLRLQFARDKSRPGASDSQIYLQYIMSLGAHAAHSF